MHRLENVHAARTCAVRNQPLKLLSTWRLRHHYRLRFLYPHLLILA